MLTRREVKVCSLRLTTPRLILVLFAIVGFTLLSVVSLRAETAAAAPFLQSPDPNIYAAPYEEWIHASNFTPSGDITFEVYDSEGGARVFGPATRITDSEGTYQIDGLGGYHLIPGSFVVVTDETSTVLKTLTIIDVSVDYINFADDIVGGSAPSGVSVGVTVGNFEIEEYLNVIAEPSGDWTADFSTIGFDIEVGMGTWAEIFDGDGDITLAGPPKERRILAIVNHGFVEASDFSANAFVTLEIFDTEGGSRVVGPTSRVTNQDGFVVIGDLPLAVGYYIVVTDDLTLDVKTLVVEYITIDTIDVDGDFVSGSADPFDEVVVGVQEDSVSVYLGEEAGAGGVWTANFNVEGFDITANTAVTAAVYDDDGDYTVFEISPSIPWIVVAHSHNYVHAHNFIPNSTLTIEIYDSYGGNLVVGPIERSVDDDGFAYLDVWTEEFDLVPGSYVIVTDLGAGMTKDIILEEFYVDAVDWDLDLIQGTAPPFESVYIEAGGPDIFPNIYVETQATPTGYWEYDFGSLGFDITGFGAHVTDEDGDTTKAGASLPIIEFSEAVHGFKFPPHSTIYLEILETSGGLSVFGPEEISVGPDGSFIRSLYDLPCDIAVPGNEVVTAATDIIPEKRLEIQPLSITNVDTTDDKVIGLAEPYQEVFVQVGFWIYYEERTTEADASGTWIADFNELGFDIEIWMPAIASVIDNENDKTSVQVWYGEVSSMVDIYPPGNRSYRLCPGDKARLEFNDWFCTEAYANNFLQVTDQHEHTLNGTPIFGTLEGAESFWRPMINGPVATTCLVGESTWILQYLYELRNLQIGDNELVSQIHLSEPITDGFDRDGDGEEDVYEGFYMDGTSFIRVYSDGDFDGDGVPDGTDNAPIVYNPDQGDEDGDGVGDVADPCPNDPTDTCNSSRSAGESVGTDGGSVDTPDGSVEVDIPSDALTEETSISISDGGSDFSLLTNEGAGEAVYSVDIGPDGTTFSEAVTIVFAWEDEDDDGFVDGTSYDELELRISKDGVMITEPCSAEPMCDPVANTFTVEVTSLSEFTLFMPLSDSNEAILDLYTLYAERFIKLKRIGESDGWVGANQWIRIYKGRAGPLTGTMSSARSVINDGVFEISGDVVVNNRLVDRGEMTILGILVENADIDAISLPDLPECDSSNQDMELKKGKTKTLSSGEYCFDNLVLADGSNLYIEPPATIIVLKTLEVGKGAHLLLTSGSSRDVRIWYLGRWQVSIGSSAEVWGTYFAPNVEVNFKSKSSLYGALYAKVIYFEKGSNFHSHP